MKYFVYDLVDPRTGKTFYVGKGQADRPRHHVTEARAGVKTHKCNVIRKILVSGMVPEVRIIFRTAREKVAYRKEAERIAYFGLHNLTNVAPGGPATLAGGKFVYACKIPDLPLFEAIGAPLDRPRSAAREPIKWDGMWTENHLRNLAPSLARAVLFLANGCKIVIPSDPAIEVSLFARRLLGEFIRALGVNTVRRHLAAQDMYFTGKEVVKIEPSVYAEIMEKWRARKSIANSQNLANSNNMLTI